MKALCLVIGKVWVRLRRLALSRQCAIREAAVAERSQSQFGPARYIQLAKDVIEVFLHRTFAKTEIVGDLLVGFGFGNKSYNLSLAKGKGVTGLGDVSAFGCTASQASVLFSLRVKSVPASSTTPGYGCATRGDSDINFLHN